LEKDKRAEFNPDKPRLNEFLTAKGKTPHDQVIIKKPTQCEDEDGGS
jgi:hypothetical protein